MNTRQIASAVLECALAWEPGARLLGNVTAREIAELARGYLKVTEMHSRGGKSALTRMSPDARKARSSAAGKASSGKLSEEQLSERARKAVAARWALCRHVSPDAITRCSLERGHEGQHRDGGLRWDQ